jgi:phosphohistidine phosphatase
MRLYLIRHASAVPSGTPGIPDEERPLTPRGEKKWKRASRGLARLLKCPDAILSSPLPRAWRTAEIAARAWDSVSAEPEAALVHDDFAAWEAAVARKGGASCVALVGHEPSLSLLLATLIGGDSSALPFRKGSVAVVDVGGRWQEGGALRAFLPPGLLRRR